jgi:hypothetical protein
MKRLETIFIIAFFSVLAISTTALADWSDYIDEVRGDTAVVKSYEDMNYTANSLVDAILSDTTASGERTNPNRVYLLKRGHYYLQDRGVSAPEGYLKIIGEPGAIVGNTAETAVPVIAGVPDGSGNSQNTGHWQLIGPSLFKNVALLPACADGQQGWFALSINRDGTQVKFNNCFFEHNTWTFIQSNDAVNSKLYFSDCYFLNMTGHDCRRNGGVYDNVNFNTDTVFVENCTHILAAGFTWKFRNYPIGHFYFNHNTFYGCTNYVFETFGYNINGVYTNNLFVNSNCQAYYPGYEILETDQDMLPTGIVNVDTLVGIEEWYPNGFPEADRKILVDRNAVFWDARLNDIVTYANTNYPDETWVSQMITMNSRTQAMFDDDDSYPYLTEGSWITDQEPDFADLEDLVPDIIEWCEQSLSDAPESVFIKWRAEGNPAEGGTMVVPDWPPLADLSYANETLRTGGLSGYPVGDLNWFPELKAQWEVQQKEAEHSALINALNTGELPTAVEDNTTETPADFKLSQNYPNPFNPSTTISYSLAKHGNVNLSIYNLLGEKIITLVDASQAAGSYQVQWNGLNEYGNQVASGVYLYRLETGNSTSMKKMTLMK